MCEWMPSGGYDDQDMSREGFLSMTSNLVMLHMSCYLIATCYHDCRVDLPALLVKLIADNLDTMMPRQSMQTSAA